MSTRSLENLKYRACARPSKHNTMMTKRIVEVYYD